MLNEQAEAMVGPAARIERRRASSGEMVLFIGPDGNPDESYKAAVKKRVGDLKKALGSIPCDHQVSSVHQTHCRPEAQLLLRLGVIKPARDAEEVDAPTEQGRPDIERPEDGLHQVTRVVDGHHRNVPTR